MTIKFSHKYEKLRGLKSGDQIKLLQVLNIKLELLTNSFITYDTDGVYPLPKRGEYLMLIFEKGHGDIFTTLRRFTPDKNEYYKCHQGEFFNVIINESEG
ncbi:MAG: hypothetical protein DYG97_10150 [Ignavibacteria bacterium CHB3]|nr:hypothetical protein [Ignavibacteria bacterium CHB3]